MADQRVTEIIISGSAGEVDWILPVARELVKAGNEVNVSFLKASAKQSFEKNETLRRITQSNCEVVTTVLLSSRGHSIWQFLTRAYRLLSRILNVTFLRYLDKFFAILCAFLFPRLHERLKNKASSVMVEFPADSRLLGAVLRGRDMNIVYFPHSPHIYYRNNIEASSNDFISAHNESAGERETYLFGSAEDVMALKNEGWSPSVNSRILTIGHPKYSQAWIEYFKTMVGDRSSDDALKVGVISRGIGTFLSQIEHQRLVGAIYGALTKLSRDVDVRIKLHPREVIFENTAWGDYLREGFSLTDDHVYKICSEVDILIIMFSSAALDAAVWSTPAIEMYDPNISPAMQLHSNGKYHTVYDLLGLVETATCEEELFNKILEISGGKKAQPKRSKMVEQLIDESNNWVEQLQCELKRW